MIVKYEVREIIDILQMLKAPFYFHAGFGMHLLGLESELDDCDIRIFHKDIDEVYEHVKKHSSHKTRLRKSVQYGRGTYDNKCIEVVNNTNFDICSRMVADCDIGRFEFPFSNKVFSDVVFLPYHGTKLPVASAENLFLYYLVLRRNGAEGKDDEKRIKDLITWHKFDRRKFEQSIPELPCSENIRKLYQSAIRKYDPLSENRLQSTYY